MEQFYKSELMFGKEAMDKLANSSVAVFGIGGVGGFAVEALVRSNLGRIALIDGDKICMTNLNRQIFALLSTVGMNKVDVAEKRIRDINAKIEIEKYPFFYKKENSHLIDLTRFDYIIDAIDTISSKLELIERANERNVKIISCMGAGNKSNPTEFLVDDIYNTSVCPLARVMRHELKKRNIKELKVVYSKETPVKPLFGDPQAPCSNSFTPSVAGLIMAGEVIKDLI